MKKLAVLVLAGVVSLGAASQAPAASHHKRHEHHKKGAARKSIVGGYTPSTSAWPWVTRVEYKDANGNGSLCTGTLISPTRVLTAAHCVSNDQDQPVPSASGFHLAINARNYTTLPGEQRTATGFARYPSYVGVGDHYNNDLAVIFLSAPVNLPTAPIGNSGDEYGNPWGWLPNGEYGYRASGMGWGRVNYPDEPNVSTDHLKAIDLWVGSNSYCSQILLNEYHANTQICAYDYYGTSCIQHGDSGGPLMVLNGGVWRLVGVTSHFGGGGLPRWGPCGGTPPSQIDDAIVDAWLAAPQYQNWPLRVGNPACGPASALAKKLKKLPKWDRTHSGKVRRRRANAKRKRAAAKAYANYVCTS